MCSGVQQKTAIKNDPEWIDFTLSIINWAQWVIKQIQVNWFYFPGEKIDII